MITIRICNESARDLRGTFPQPTDHHAGRQMTYTPTAAPPAYLLWGEDPGRVKVADPSLEAARRAPAPKVCARILGRELPDLVRLW